MQLANSMTKVIFVRRLYFIKFVLCEAGLPMTLALFMADDIIIRRSSVTTNLS